MKITDTHVYFWRGFLSNWHPAQFKDSLASDLIFSNTEQAFMFWKARQFKDYAASQEIARTTDPQKVKKLGRAIKNFNEAEWNEHKFHYMVYANTLKFHQNNELARQLAGTKDKTLVEASPYDIIWGVGLAEDDPLILEEKNWCGQNLLGKALMEVRKGL